MRILITTGLSGTDIGGPFQYAPRLRDEFEKMGHEVKVVSYSSVEKVLPPWVRHLYFLLRIVGGVIWSNRILALDTYSVGVPSVLVAKFLGKKITIRVGGDFLWSAYVNRTSEPLTLPAFYQNMPKLNLKEKIIFFFTKILINRGDFLAFNTEWQRNIWRSFYKIKEGKSGVVRNFIPNKSGGRVSIKRNFLWAGRIIPEKNIDLLRRVGERVVKKHPEFRLDIVTGESHQKVLERIRECYAVASLAFSDICPNFIIEAASCGKPFIMTRETGLNEIFPKGGLFVDPLDEIGLEKAIEMMLEDNAYNVFAEELKRSKVTHSWGEMAKEILDIWRKCP